MPIDYATAKEKLYAAVFADILDDMGFRDQVMDTAIRPLQPESLVVVIPEKVATEVMERAIEAAELENRVRSDLLAGSSMRAACEAHRAL
jgi:hypothetical protein